MSLDQQQLKQTINMKKTLTIIILSGLFNTNCVNPSKEEFQNSSYVFSATVEVAIINGIALSQRTCDSCMYLRLSKSDKDSGVEILTIPLANIHVQKFIKQSNQYTVVQKRRIPIIFEAQMDSIIEANHSLSNAGGGYNIKYDKSGKIVGRYFQN